MLFTDKCLLYAEKRAGDIADLVRKAQRHRLLARPVLAGEQHVLGSLEARAAAALDQCDEDGVDLALKRLQARHVGIGQHVVGWRDHRREIIGGVAQGGERNERRH